MGTSVKVGIVGAGFAASFHLRSYQQVKEVPVEVVAIASKTRARAEQLAGRYGIAKVYDDYRSLLDDPSIAIVDLCVPNALHLPLVLETVKAGKHVICEKPLTGYFGQGEPDDEVGATSKRTMLDKVRADLAEVTRTVAGHPSSSVTRKTGSTLPPSAKPSRSSTGAWSWGLISGGPRRGVP